MNFDWSEYLTLAVNLPALNTGAGVEARLRTAISRAYYGAFHLVRQRLLHEDPARRFSASADAHQEVVQLLATSGNSARRQLGLDLGRLRAYRNQADYHDEIPKVPQWHSFALAHLEGVQKRLAQIK